MITPYKILEFLDYREKHHDYFLLINEYSGTELYKEIIHFMNLAFPEWTSNAGIGRWAAEFVLTAIQNLEYTEEKEYTSLETLKDMYVGLAEDYHSAKKEYQLSVLDDILYDFDLKYGDYLDENKDLPDNDFNALYQELYNNYKSEYLSRRTYSFIENN